MKVELKRLVQQSGDLSLQYSKPLMDDYMTLRAIDSPRNIRLWTWQDATKIANFY